MYTKQLNKKVLPVRTIRADLRRYMCAALAFFCAICFCLNPLRVSALATEVIITAGCLLAFLSACGILYNNFGVGDEPILQTIYDAFVDWNSQVQAFDDIASLISKMAIYRGYLQIDAVTSGKLSEFAEYIYDNPISYFGDNVIDIADIGYPVLNINSISDLPDVLPYHLSYDTGYPIVINGVTKTFVAKLIGDGYEGEYKYHCYIDGVELSKQQSLSTTRSGEQIEGYVFVYCNGYFGIGASTQIRAGNNNWVKKLTTYKNFDLELKEQSFTSVSETLNLPTDINTNKEVYITQIPNVTTLDEYAENTVQKTQANILSTTWQASTQNEIDDQIDNIPPDIGDYDFSAIGQLLQHKFPFSIPHDIQLAAQMLHYQSEAPVWSFTPFDIYGVPETVAETEVTIDLSDDTYNPLLSILRWGIVILYVAGLASISKDMIFD